MTSWSVALDLFGCMAYWADGDVVIFALGIEAGALLDPFIGGDVAVAVAVGAEVTVAEDGSLWGECVEVLKELTEGRALLGGAGVCWMARII